MLWILVVLLPVQGIAAAMGCACTMAHPAPQAGQAGFAADWAQPDRRTPAAHQDMPCDQGKHQKHSSCRVCCAGFLGASAPPPFAVASVMIEPAASEHISPNSFFAGWIPTRIERPPRS